MENPDKRIISFIRKHHVLTLATVSDNKPWCANCFYSFMDDKNMLVFTSDNATQHIKNINENSQVAASIVLETKVIGKIQGIQLTGEAIKPSAEIANQVKINYLKRFPFAILMNTSLWVLIIHQIKFTDNSLGFGKKLFWKNEL